MGEAVCALAELRKSCLAGFEPLMQSVRTWVAAELAEGRREEALSGGRSAVPSEHAIRPIGAT